MYPREQYLTVDSSCVGLLYEIDIEKGESL